MVSIISTWGYKKPFFGGERRGAAAVYVGFGVQGWTTSSLQPGLMRKVSHSYHAFYGLHYSTNTYRKHISGVVVAENACKFLVLEPLGT